MPKFKWSNRCGACGEIVDSDNWNEIKEDCAIYCHNVDWSIPGGSCWEQRVIEDFPECKELLHYGFNCDGCQVDSNGECTCTSLPDP